MIIGVINGLIYYYRITPLTRVLKGKFIIRNINHQKKRINVYYIYKYKKIKITLNLNKYSFKKIKNMSEFEGVVILPKNYFLIKRHNYFGIIADIHKYKPINFLQKYRKNLILSIERKFIENHDLVLGLLLGEKKYLPEKNGLSLLGLSHLTAVSGLHMNSIFFIIFTLFRLILLPWPVIGHYIAYIIAIFTLFFLLIMSNFSPSATRSFLMHLCYIITKIFYLKYNKFFIWGGVFFIMTIFDGGLIEHPSFLMSFFAILGLYIAGDVPIKNKGIMGIIYRQILINSFIIPISISFFHGFNLMSILWNLIFIPIFSNIIILCILSLLFNFLSGIVDYLITLLMITINSLSNFSFLLKFKNFKYLNTIILFYFLPFLLFIYTQYSINFTVPIITTILFMGISFIFDYLSII